MISNLLSSSFNSFFFSYLYYFPIRIHPPPSDFMVFMVETIAKVAETWLKGRVLGFCQSRKSMPLPCKGESTSDGLSLLFKENGLTLIWSS